MPRTFDGVDDEVVVAVGGLSFAFGPGTIAAVVKRASNGVIHDIVTVGPTSGRFGLFFGATDALSFRINNTTRGPSSMDTCVAADGWLLVCATKATGTVLVRFHRYEYGTNVWQHSDGSTTVANSTATGVGGYLGSRSAAGFLAGDLGVAGVWNVVLTDAQIEAMAYSLPAWFAVQPKGLWVLDQAATTQNVIDITGGGANQSAIVGTAVGTSSLPVFSYGQPVIYGRRPAAVAAGPAVANSLMMMGWGV